MKASNLEGSGSRSEIRHSPPQIIHGAENLLTGNWVMTHFPLCSLDLSWPTWKRQNCQSEFPFLSQFIIFSSGCYRVALSWGGNRVLTAVLPGATKVFDGLLAPDWQFLDGILQALGPPLFLGPPLSPRNAILHICFNLPLTLWGDQSPVTVFYPLWNKLFTVCLGVQVWGASD